MAAFSSCIVGFRRKKGAKKFAHCVNASVFVALNFFSASWRSQRRGSNIGEPFRAQFPAVFLANRLPCDNSFAKQKVSSHSFPPPLFWWCKLEPFSAAH
jgi:hypothetical protein